MSEITASALPGAEFAGFVTLHEAGLQGMITLRGDLGAKAIVTALKDATGCTMPEPRKINRAGDCAVAWMSPDELLILCPHKGARDIAAKLSGALAGEFATVAEVSDARAVFTLSGAGWRDALAKLCPVDFGALQQGDIRRTRAAQVAAAVLVTTETEAMVICFRSVGQYMFDLLSVAAAPGSEPALYI